MGEFDPTFVGAVPEFEAAETANSAQGVVQIQGNSAAAAAVEAVPAAQAPMREGEPTTIAPTLPAVSARPVPIPWPLPRPVRRAVSGRYRSAGHRFQLELRVDVDGARPTMHVSGDFYSTSGATTTYHSSWRIDSISLPSTYPVVLIEGIGSFTFPAAAPKLQVRIPRTPQSHPGAHAIVQFFTLAGVPGATYLCHFQSDYLRSVRYEQDYEVGVTPFVSYDTSQLPSGGPARTLSVAAAYAEAGIEMQTSGVWNAIPAPPGGTWSNAELHAAMQVQFSLWVDLPQWAVWLLAAHEHEFGSGLYGIMFDQQGAQRQGCATFDIGIGGATPDKQRLQQYTYTHELGHCFNLLHSWQKGLATPPAPNRPAALSWMNYPWYYPGGASAFWSAFPFQFDDLEVIHLRHAFRNDIIMGGNPFTVGSALRAAEALGDPEADGSGVQVELRGSSSVAFGEPVVVEIKLSATDQRGKLVHTLLHPNFGALQIAIRKPSGSSVVYEPLIAHCAEAKLVRLDADRPALYASAYIGYGKGGFYFDEVGPYQIRGLYAALDGSQIVSKVMKIWVRAPREAADQEVAELLQGDQQGALLYLLGSDSPFLRSGNDALEAVVEKHPDHPLAVYARLARGVNLAREFKTITPEKEVTVRPPQIAESTALLGPVIDASAADKGVDNITLNEAMRALVRGQKTAGDDKAARATADRMVDIFRKKSLNPHVMQVIEQQAAEALERSN